MRRHVGDGLRLRHLSLPPSVTCAIGSARGQRAYRAIARERDRILDLPGEGIVAHQQVQAALYLPA